MNIANLEVLKGLVAQKNTKVPQLIRVSISTQDIATGVAELKWYNVHNGTVDEPFASANIFYSNADSSLSSWAPITHLITSRIEALDQLADKGEANVFSHNMAYNLFANNLVDYHSKYRGMQKVVLKEFEAYADVRLTTEKGGSWTVPPYFIDSVAHLAGFIMNCTDAIDTKNNFCVTPGWGSMRFAKPLVAGQSYRSYVKMIPTAEDPSVYLGDVYILQDNVIMGLVGGIKFRKYPRLLLNRFFSAPDDSKAPPVASAAPAAVPTAKPVAAAPLQVAKPSVLAPPVAVPAPPMPATATQPTVAAPAKPSLVAAAPVAASDNSTAIKAIQLIANEAALDLSDLTDDATFANLGVDSLMSLVIAEKFREELGVTVNGSLFLEYPTVGDLRGWLLEYYS